MVQRKHTMNFNKICRQSKLETPASDSVTTSVLNVGFGDVIKLKFDETKDSIPNKIKGNNIKTTKIHKETLNTDQNKMFRKQDTTSGMNFDRFNVKKKSLYDALKPETDHFNVCDKIYDETRQRINAEINLVSQNQKINYDFISYILRFY